jgi:hypothetical protein
MAFDDGEARTVGAACVYVKVFFLSQESENVWAQFFFANMAEHAGEGARRVDLISGGIEAKLFQYLLAARGSR